MIASQVGNVMALSRLVIENTPAFLSSADESTNLINRFKDSESLDDLEKQVDFAFASQPIFQSMVDAFESEANEYSQAIDPDRTTVACLEENEELMKRIRSVVKRLITEYLRKVEQDELDQRVLNQLLRVEKTFQQFIHNLQRCRWIILSIDGGLAPSTGRTFHSAEEFVMAQFEEA